MAFFIREVVTSHLTACSLVRNNRHVSLTAVRADSSSTSIGEARRASRREALKRMRLVAVVCAAFCSQGEITLAFKLESHLSKF